MAGCSTKKNTAGSRFWQAFVTRFNVYFNGSEAYKEGMLAIETGNKDNYQQIIPLYPIGNKGTVGIGEANFDRAIEKSQKAIKLHSIKKKPKPQPNKRNQPEYKRWMAQKEYNPFLHNAWMLMGKAQFQKGEFLEAASTFSYISRLYATDPKLVAEARIWMAQCYTQMDWFYEAEDALEKLNNDSLPDELTPEHANAYGNFLLRQKRFKEAIPFLQITIKNEKRNKQKAREYYLLGQIYKETGDYGNAYRAYGKTIKLNPPYELELSARIKQTEVIPAGKTEKTIKTLRKMARNGKNAEYQDQIYYAIGNIHLSRQDTANALKEYKEGVEKSTRNGLEKGIILLRLGEACLNYAEALGRMGRIADAVRVMNMTRTQHGGLPALSENVSEEEFWKNYKTERRVELALEGDRYFSVIRWAKVENATSVPEFNQPTHVIIIDGDDDTFTLSDQPHGSSTGSDRVFSWPKRMYFPIPESETMSNPNLSQNNYW